MSLYSKGTCTAPHLLVSLSFREEMLCLYRRVFFLVQSDKRYRSLGGQSGTVTMRLEGKHLSNGDHNRYLQIANECERDDIFHILRACWW